MRVLYSCVPCSVKDAPVEVVDRRGGEDVVHWVTQVVGAAIGSDHRQRSPQCVSMVMSEVKIPIAGSDEIGKPPKN